MTADVQSIMYTQDRVTARRRSFVVEPRRTEQAEVADRWRVAKQIASNVDDVVKNQRDFAMARPNLTAEAAMWLTGALEITLPGHH